MRRVLAADAAELLQLQPLGHRLPVLGRRIVPLFAFTALQLNDFSGHKEQLLAREQSLACRSNLGHPEAASAAEGPMHFPQCSKEECRIYFFIILTSHFCLPY
jgi:hypothetical protein